MMSSGNHPAWPFNKLHLRALAIGLVMLALIFWSTAAVAAPDTSEWKCEFCPFEKGTRANYEIGATVVSDDAIRYGNGTGYDEQGVFPLLSGAGNHNSERLNYRWRFDDLGIDSRSAEFGVSKSGIFDVNLSYQGLPYRLFDSTSTVFSNAPGNALILPASWTRSGVTSGFTQLPGSLVRQNIESDRDVIAIRGHYRPASRFQLHAEYRRQEQKGVKVIGGSFFTNSTQLPASFDYSTNEIDFGLAYKGNRSRVEVGFYASMFQNAQNSLIWDNPFESFSGAERGALARPPENNFAQVSLKGAWSVGTTTRLSLAAAAGRAEQDDALLSYTINSNLSASPLPRSQLDGEIDTTNLSLSLSSRPLSNVAVALKYRFDERDNQTPQEVWSRIILDSFSTADTVINTPYSFERSRLSASAVADWRSDLQISGGIERVETDRDFQEVAEQTEDIGWGKIRWTPNSAIDVHARAGTAKREIDRYDTGVAINLGQNPLLRKYNLSHRFREFGEVTLMATLPEKPLSFSVGVVLSDDDYSQSVLGLLSSKEISYSGDLSWSVSEKTLLSVSGGLEQIDARQAGGTGLTVPDWFATHDDEFISYGVGLLLKEVGDRVDVRMDYSHGEGTSQIAVNSATNPDGRFPDLQSDLDTLRVSATYKRSERIEWIGELRYERLQSSDWALQGVAPSTIPLVLSLGATPYDYDVFQFGVRFRYHFGYDALSNDIN